MAGEEGEPSDVGEFSFLAWWGLGILLAGFVSYKYGLAAKADGSGFSGEEKFFWLLLLLGPSVLFILIEHQLSEEVKKGRATLAVYWTSLFSISVGAFTVASIIVGK